MAVRSGVECRHERRNRDHRCATHPRDREWYEPFQRFRLRLVALLDDVFERMDRDPRQRFTLDGQLAAVDDYLEVRPEQRERVVALVRAGRLAVGPSQILLDEFLFVTQPSDVDGLPVVPGELRSHARANILPGVYSVRAHLK